MLKAKHNKLYFWFFWSFYELMRKIHFRKLSVIDHLEIPENHSVLLFQNHFSWWDGYWSYLLSRTIFKRKFHVMMDENNLYKHMFLNRIGVFSVRNNGRDILESLEYSSSILKAPGNLLTIYPSGVMYTQHKQTIQFKRGVDRILQNDNKNCTIVFAVFLLDYFGFARPEIRIYLEHYSGDAALPEMSKAFNSFYMRCTEKQTE